MLRLTIDEDFAVYCRLISRLLKTPSSQMLFPLLFLLGIVDIAICRTPANCSDHEHTSSPPDPDDLQFLPSGHLTAGAHSLYLHP